MECNFFESNACQCPLGKIGILGHEQMDFPRGAQGAEGRQNFC